MIEKGVKAEMQEVWKQQEKGIKGKRGQEEGRQGFGIDCKCPEIWD